MDDNGLRFAGLSDWQRWADRQHRVEGVLRGMKARLRPVAPAATYLSLPPGEVRTLVVIDVHSPSCRFAIHAPLAHLDPSATAVLTNVPDLDLRRGEYRTEAVADLKQLPRSIDTVLTLGSYLPLAGRAREWGMRNGARHVVVQHGLLTPLSPPAADGDHLLAWTPQDADYWRDGRASVTTEVVGSQMLWAAGESDPVDVADDRPVMLGQLHGTELSRRETFEQYWTFCRGEDADYRPHPNEADAASRSLHKVMRQGGITFETSGRSLTDLARPVVSIFSTGTLEAAHRGLPAWVRHSNPPTWVEGFWERYRLSQYGSDPTPAWHRPALEPAAAVAAAL